MEIEMVPIGKVRLCCGNFPRRECHVEKLARHIKEFGWQQPIVVDITYMVVTGHTRLLAAQFLKLKKVPVLVARELTPAQIQKFRDADNAPHPELEWDEEFNELLADVRRKEARDAAKRKRRWREARGMASV